MSFSSELFRGIKDSVLMPFTYSATIINGGAIYIDGFEKILSLNNEEIVFSAKKQRLKIVGASLEIAKMEEFSCVVVGKVEGFYVE